MYWVECRPDNDMPPSLLYLLTFLCISPEAPNNEGGGEKQRLAPEAVQFSNLIIVGEKSYDRNTPRAALYLFILCRPPISRHYLASSCTRYKYDIIIRYGGSRDWSRTAMSIYFLESRAHFQLLYPVLNRFYKFSSYSYTNYKPSLILDKDSWQCLFPITTATTQIRADG